MECDGNDPIVLVEYIVPILQTLVSNCNYSKFSVCGLIIVQLKSENLQ